MASTINLNCPRCTKDLEIDGGFAGGVCRCADCDCLIAVPRRGSQKAEMIRPAKPGEVAAIRKQAQADAKGESATQDWPGEDEFIAEEDDLLADDRSDVHGETYITESGRSVKVDTANVPTANLARARRLTSAAVVLITLGVIALLAVGGWFTIQAIKQPKTPKQSITTETVVQIFPYAPHRNPMTLDKPNAMGMSLRDPCVLMININSDQADLHAELTTQLSHGLSLDGSSAHVLVAYRANGRSLFMTNEPVPLNEITAKQVTDFLRPLRPGDGRADALIKDALETLEEKPDQLTTAVVWLQVGNPDPSDLTAIADLLADQPDRRVDVLLIKASGLMGTEDALASNPGEVQSLSGIKLDRWLPFAVPAEGNEEENPDVSRSPDSDPTPTTTTKFLGGLQNSGLAHR